jgi:hypothetical protein
VSALRGVGFGRLSGLGLNCPRAFWQVGPRTQRPKPLLIASGLAPRVLKP